MIMGNVKLGPASIISMIKIFLGAVSDSSSLLQDCSTHFPHFFLVYMECSHMCSHHNATVPELEATSALQEHLSSPSGNAFGLSTDLLLWVASLGSSSSFSAVHYRSLCMYHIDGLCIL